MHTDAKQPPVTEEGYRSATPEKGGSVGLGELKHTNDRPVQGAPQNSGLAAARPHFWYWS